MLKSYRELIVKGDLKLLKGFLRGYQIARRIKSGLIICKDSPIKTRHLREVLRLHGNYVHLISGERIRKNLIAAIRGAADLGFEIVSDAPIRRSVFAFKFDTANRKVAGKLKRSFSRLPAGLKLSRFDPLEDIDPTAKGVEIFTPVHEYRFHGTGEVEGPIEQLLRFHRKLRENEFVDVENVSIEK